MALCEETYWLYVLHISTQHRLARPCGKPLPMHVGLDLCPTVPISPMVYSYTAYTAPAR